MDETGGPTIRRRDLFRLAAAVSVTSAAAVGAATGTAGRSKDDRGKRKSQYQANAPEVLTFYRVNRYPVK
jgi:hypothetical protein